MPDEITTTLKWGSHSLSIKGIKPLHNEYADMVEKQQWIILSVSMLKLMFGLHLSFLWLVPQFAQHGQQDQIILDYSFFQCEPRYIQYFTRGGHAIQLRLMAVALLHPSH